MGSPAMALPAGAKILSLPPGAKLASSSGKDFSVFGIPENPVTDALAGAGSSLAQHAVNIYDLLRKIPGADKILPNSADLHKAIADATPDNTPAHVGRFLEGAAEFMVPAGKAAEATKAMGLTARTAGQVAAGSGVAAVQSGGDPTATVVSGLLSAAGPLASAAAGKFGPELAENLYQSALKPTWSMAKKQGLQMVDTGLGLKIPVSADGAAALDTHIQNLRDAINTGIDQNAKAGKMVDSHAALTALDDLKKWAGNTLDPQSKLDAIQKLEDEFIQAHGTQIPLDKAQQLKINTYGEIKNSYGQMSAVETEAKKQLARGLKEQISAAFPEIAGLNEEQSKALGLDEALTRAVWRIDNHNMIGIGAPLAAAGGHALLGAPGALASVLGKLVIDNPTLKSKIAIAMGKQGLQNATAVVGSRLNDLLKEGTVNVLGRPIAQLSTGPAQ